MAAKKNIRMRVLLGKDPMVDEPFIAGALDEKSYDTMVDEEWSYARAAWAEQFDTAVYSYEWREVWITVPAEKLQQVFEPKAIAAEVES